MEAQTNSVGAIIKSMSSSMRPTKSAAEAYGTPIHSHPSIPKPQVVYFDGGKGPLSLWRAMLKLIDQARFPHWEDDPIQDTPGRVLQLVRLACTKCEVMTMVSNEQWQRVPADQQILKAAAHNHSAAVLYTSSCPEEIKVVQRRVVQGILTGLAAIVGLTDARKKG